MNDSGISISFDSRGIATLWFDRPQKKNAFDDHVVANLRASLLTLANEETVKILVIAAKGSCFSAGADLAWMQRMVDSSFDDNLSDAKALACMLKELDTFPKPTIARIQGPALGGAVGLVCCCDLAVASEKAYFCLSEVKLGLIPATIGPYVVARLGAKASRRYFLTAEVIDAELAQQLHLVDAVVPSEALDDTVEMWVTALLGNSLAAVSEAKQLVRDLSESEVTEQLLEDTSLRIARLRTSEDGQSRLKDFLQRC